jgi:hypothetical protein
MSRHGAPSWLAWEIGDAYTLHFWPPFGDPEVQASGHYSGWAHEGKLRSRLVDHFLGRGARLTKLQRQAGGSWVLADVEHGVTKDREHQLKYRSAARRCSVCKASRDIEAGRITKEEALAKWPDAKADERAILREIFGMEPELVKAPEPVKEIKLDPGPGPIEITSEMDALVDELCAKWQAELAAQQAEAFQGTPPFEPGFEAEAETEYELEAG